jgi:hypothetical protein
MIELFQRNIRERTSVHEKRSPFYGLDQVSLMASLRRAAIAPATFISSAVTAFSFLVKATTFFPIRALTPGCSGLKKYSHQFARSGYLKTALTAYIPRFLIPDLWLCS